MFNSFGTILVNQFANFKNRITMKKSVLLLAASFAVSTTFAQDLTSKKGEPYLPEAGDWAISFDAVPFLNYAGSFFSNAGATAPTGNYIGGLPWHIRGKMFKDEKTAFRAGLRLGFGSTKTTAMISSLTPGTPTFPTGPAMVEDEVSQGATNIVLSGGLEMRRGKTRLQGYYGGELFIAFSSAKDKYTYGNAMDAPGLANLVTTNFVATTGYANTGATDPYGYGSAGRITETGSSSMTIGLRGFIGAEYFIFPKISIGVEYGWGLGFGSSKTSETVEVTDGTTIATIEDDTRGKTGNFGFDTDINYAPSGQLNLILHF